MATLTAYQRQFRTRMKRAIRMRASADAKARRYAQKLVDALGVADDAAAQMNALNQLYNVDVSTQTILVHDLQQLVTPAQLTAALAGSTPGEELVIFNQIPDGNGGQPLSTDPLFGEVAAGTPIVIVVPSPPQVVDNISPQAQAPEQMDG
ncbi:hypothetical protein [Hymenobacter pini]|uniref:hypothetical protein n=1 Tax=Hymenobacter pini TaxID=2880879 RepID=UPI001CF4F96C|nr:hypothetical protein [Hymenobacter pini]MCA8831940.1 hypothetical protein [Hymenobacter pini]